MPHYTADNPAHIGTQVFLDGQPLKDVIECDTDEGWAIVAKRNDKGSVFLSEDGDTVATARIEGVVTAITAA